ncbi:hypothetical protein GCM10027285_24520 [Oleiagrimonas citrea]
MILYKYMWRVHEERIVYRARQQTELMESVRGVQAIKLANKQALRNAKLMSATYEAARRDLKSQRIDIAFNALSKSISAGGRVFLVTVGAYLVIKANFTLGMLVAFLVIADQFMVKGGALIDKFIEFRMLKLHAERISDIALAEEEAFASSAYSGADPDPTLVMESISFRYSDSDPWLFDRYSLKICEGESVAIIGPSGCGKSTLAKLMLGLLNPCDGKISVGGVDIRVLGMNRYRGMVAVVMQDDNLFAGSIADNISFFDQQANFEDVCEAARAAGIFDEISVMPMGFETLVGDMGSSLSGGQKQRIILARALYRKPKILVLDEATSHLDVRLEKYVNSAIQKMNMTRIVIAHRPETIASADRVIDLGALGMQKVSVPEGVANLA